MNKVKQIELKAEEIGTSKRTMKKPVTTQRWVFADAFLAVVSLAILNATLVYSTLITLQFSRVTELVISGVLVLILNLHIAKRIF
jgi:hypothetical protein